MCKGGSRVCMYVCVCVCVCVCVKGALAAAQKKENTCAYRYQIHSWMKWMHTPQCSANEKLHIIYNVGNQ